MTKRQTIFFFFKQKTAYEIVRLLEFRRVLFRSRRSHEHQLRAKEMNEPVVNSVAPAETAASRDEQLLKSLGYKQELARRMSGFSNFAISLSIICILAGGITSFHVGFCTVGGASIGIGWPLVCVFSLVVAAT